MGEAVCTLKGPGGELLVARRVMPGDRDVQFLRARLREGDWPFSGKHQGWGPFAQDGASFLECRDQRLPTGELYILFRQENDAPVACASLLSKDMTRWFDESLPVEIEALTPWRSCVAVAPGYENMGYEALIGEVVLRRAKKLGFAVVYLFVDLATDGVIPDTWRGFPCEKVWQGRYCDGFRLPNGQPGSTRPEQLVLAIPLKNVPDHPTIPT